MLEFYQAYTDYRGVMDLTQELIEQATKECELEAGELMRRGRD